MHLKHITSVQAPPAFEQNVEYERQSGYPKWLGSKTLNVIARGTELCFPLICHWTNLGIKRFGLVLAHGTVLLQSGT